MKYDGTVIHSARDEFGLIEVVDNKVTRKLFFDSPIEQSCLFLNAPMNLNFEYQEKIIEQVLNVAQKRKSNQDFRVLMLGMGGGSMAHHLFHALPNLQMTVVELRQAVIDCAYQFFQLPDEPEIDVIQEDAIQFVAENSFQYDVVIVDIFDAHGLPSQLSDASFQLDLWKNLNSTGLLIFNLWNEMNDNDSAIPTPETEAVLDYWQQQIEDRQEVQLNKYNIQSSSNLILTLQR